MATLTYQERFKTLKGVFDEFTNRTLFELQSKGLFEELLSPFSVGKESSIFIARKGKQKVIVKVYFVQNCNFNKMYDYIKKDPRYEYLQKHRRQIILAWVQREYKNLLRAEKARVNAPRPLGCKNHILVETLIGDELPAAKLKDLPPENPRQFLKDVITEIKKLYDNGLIHGDLSSFNILNYKEKPFLIDFSQATLVKTPNSGELLERDLKNVLSYFNKLGVNASVEKTFIIIAGK
ncbi:MAG: RIO1 family regulatory kinase/ATPase [Nanoarchaeota archaeon]